MLTCPQMKTIQVDPDSTPLFQTNSLYGNLNKYKNYRCLKDKFCPQVWEETKHKKHCFLISQITTEKKIKRLVNQLSNSLKTQVENEKLKKQQIMKLFPG